MAEHRDIGDVLRRENPDWWPAAMIQLVYLVDGLQVMVHDDDGRAVETATLDVEPLRCAMQLPLSAEKRLFATASALAFDETDAPVSRELLRDLHRAYSK